jgi:aspartate/methionine/tyrosine aminotransferase
MDIMIQALTKASLPDCRSEATFYIWQRAPAGMSGCELAQKLLEIGIVSTPGQWLADTTAKGLNPGVDYIRLALVPPLLAVKEAAKRININYYSTTTS